nr:hypothetical protein [Streptomyces sp. TLI_185]
MDCQADGSMAVVSPKACGLGEPVAHPTVPSVDGKYAFGVDNDHGGRADQWHSDVTFVPAYPAFSPPRHHRRRRAGGRGRPPLDTPGAASVPTYGMASGASTDGKAAEG